MSTSATSLLLPSLRQLFRWFYLALMGCLLSLSTAQAQSPVAPVLAPYTPNPNGIVSGIYSHQIIYSGTATRLGRYLEHGGIARIGCGKCRSGYALKILGIGGGSVKINLPLTE